MIGLTIPILGINMPIMGICADALFTKMQQRVLAVIYGQSQRSFYANEIIGLAAIGSGAVQRELARLEASALVTVRRVGNQKHYQANHEAPIFEELRGIVLKTFGVADVLRAALHSVWPLVDFALNHDLRKLFDRFVEISGYADWASLKSKLDVFPAIHERYNEQSHPLIKVWDGFVFAQSIGTVIVREKTGRNTVARVLASSNAMQGTDTINLVPPPDVKS